MLPTSLRIAFAGTPDFAARHLSALLDQGANVVAVFSQPDRPAGRGKKILPTPVKAIAQAHSIPVFQPVALDTPAESTRLESLALDVMIVVAYGLILKPATLAIPRLGCINVHASLLPRWRGAAPVERAILAGDPETGICIMQVDAGLDTGDILLTRRTPIEATDNAATVTDRLIALGSEGLATVLQDLPVFQAGAAPQDSSAATYAAKLTKQDAQVHWNVPAETIHRQVQAFFPRSPAWSYYQGERVRLIQALPDATPTGEPPGTILHADRQALVVACHDNRLQITRLQFPGKKPASIADLLNGNADQFPAGAQFSDSGP